MMYKILILFLKQKITYIVFFIIDRFKKNTLKRAPVVDENSSTTRRFELYSIPKITQYTIYVYDYSLSIILSVITIRSGMAGLGIRTVTIIWDRVSGLDYLYFRVNSTAYSHTNNHLLFYYTMCLFVYLLKFYLFPFFAKCTISIIW